jgi:hypothetical protein
MQEGPAIFLIYTRSGLASEALDLAVEGEILDVDAK